MTRAIQEKVKYLITSLVINAGKKELMTGPLVMSGKEQKLD